MDTNAIQGVFTSFDTVSWSDETEIFTNEYFDFLNKGILNGTVCKCSYDAINEEFSYIYDNTNYVLKVTNNTRNLRILLNLLALEKEKRIQDEENEAEAKRKEGLIADAKIGNIVSEEARVLYLNSLRAERKQLFFGQEKITENKNLELLAASTALITVVDFAIHFVIGACFVYNYGAFITTLYAIAALVRIIISFIKKATNIENSFSMFVAKTLTFIPNTIKNLKQNFSKIRILNHKIKCLKEYKPLISSVNFEVVSDPNKTFNGFINKYVNNIYVKISQLDEDDKKEFIAELLKGLNEFQSGLKGLQNRGLTTISEDYLRRSLVVYLSGIEQRIDNKLGNSAESKSIEDVMSTLQNELDDNSSNLQDSTGKTKKLVPYGGH